MNAPALQWLVWAGSLLALLGATPAWASAAPQLDTLSQPGSSVNTAWWQAFQDPLLDGLIARSGSQPGGRQLAVVATYIQLRVAQSRLLLATRLQDAVATQRRLLQDDDSAADDDRQRGLQDTAARQLHWARMQTVMADACDAALAALAQYSGSGVAQLREQLQAAGSAPQVPQVQQALPAAAAAARPTAWTAETSTVSAQRLALLGQAETNGDDGPPSQLRALLASAAHTAQARQLVRASQLDLQSHQLRLQAGNGSPLGALEAYQRLVVDADRLTALSGVMAVAWAAWLETGAAGR